MYGHMQSIIIQQHITNLVHTMGVVLVWLKIQNKSSLEEGSATGTGWLLPCRTQNPMTFKL